jgi:uncharacterized protein
MRFMLVLLPDSASANTAYHLPGTGTRTSRSGPRERGLARFGWMKVVITGATGLIGSRLVARLQDRGDEVTVLTRDPGRARGALGVPAVRWLPGKDPAPAESLAAADGVVHLAGEVIAQRWSRAAKRRIRESRTVGTRNLVAGLRAAEPRPSVLVSGSAVGYYGARGDERLDESAGPGSDFLAEVVRAWEHEADLSAETGMRLVKVRTGIVLHSGGGALAKMLPFFKAGLGGPVAGGRQRVPWVHLDDEVGIILAALDDARWMGPVNASAPEPVTNRELAKVLGRALRRPAVLPVPAAALKLLYGEMAETVTTGQRAVPARALALGYRFAHPDLDEALADALSRS